MLEWRKGYPSEEMIAAHSSRLWLVKGKCWLVKKLLSFDERIERNELDLVVKCTYKHVYHSDEIIIVDPVQYYKRGADFNEFYLFDNGNINIIQLEIGEKYDTSGDVEVYCYGEDSVFTGEWDGDSVKQVKAKYADTQYKAETVLKLLQEQGKLQQTENQRLYAEDYFCPIDEDGNKVHWPSSVAPRGFISWVDWNASRRQKSLYTVSISYSDGTIKHLNREQLIEFIETCRDAGLVHDLNGLLNVQEVLIKKYEGKKNLIKMNFKFVFSDDTKESV